MESQKDYAKGYSAGKRKAEKDLESVRNILDRDRRNLQHDTDLLRQYRRDRLMTETLDSVLAHCAGWSIGGKKINSADGYVQLTKVFVDSIIKINL